MKLRDFKGKKNHRAGLFLKSLDSEIFAKIKHLGIFLKNGDKDFFVFLPEFSTKYELQFE